MAPPQGRLHHRFRFGGITDPTRAFEHEHVRKRPYLTHKNFQRRPSDLIVRRRQVYNIIDEAPVQRWVVLVAGAGFLTDAYDLFAVNTVLPMISFVYWGGWDESDATVPTSISTALLCATLAGAVFGQVTFGVLGDLFGRKKMYGLLILVVLWATLGLTASADGSNSSMSITGWLFVWRFFMGIAVGGDYPLSATIVSEFSPKRHRSRMLAWLFFMQPLGQFLATLVAVVATASFKSKMHDQGHCTTPGCFRAVDSAWRWIVGIGILPALLAMIIRLQIPESPRYTMDVLLDGKKALKDTRGYFIVAEDPLPLQGGNGQLNGSLPASSRANPDILSSTAQTLNHDERQNGTANLSTSEEVVEQQSISFANIHPQYQPRTSIPIHAGTWPPESMLHGQIQNQISPMTFPEWWLGFKTYFLKDRNWVHLAGTMATCSVLDISFYGLGMSSPVTIQMIFNNQTQLISPKDTPSSVYSILMGNAWHPLIVVSLPALLGALVMIYVIEHSRPVKIQGLTFIILAVFFFVTGGTFKCLLNTNQGHWGLVALYMMRQLFFNLGPNATTFIIPAEQFKTQYRCTANGLSAAAGKLGAVIGQLTVTRSYANDPPQEYLGYLIIGLGGLMLVGAVATQLAVPDSRDAAGTSMSLEEIALGEARMANLRSSTWNRWHTVKADPLDADTLHS